MSTPAGRVFVWDLLGHVGVFNSGWDPHGGRLNYNIGRRDVGLELMAEIIEAVPDFYQLMETEARSQAKRDEAEITATHTARAADQAERQE